MEAQLGDIESQLVVDEGNVAAVAVDADVGVDVVAAKGETYSRRLFGTASGRRRSLDPWVWKSHVVPALSRREPNPNLTGWTREDLLLVWEEEKKRGTLRLWFPSLTSNSNEN